MAARKNLNEKPQPAVDPDYVAAPNRTALECASRTIRIDHLADKADSEVIPVFLDSKSCTEAVVALLDYHGHSRRLVDVGLIANLAEAAKYSSIVTFGINEAISYIVVDEAAYQRAKEDPTMGAGSDMETGAFFLGMAQDMRRAAYQDGKGEFDAVFAIDKD
jgi:hypothetical protein